MKITKRNAASVINDIWQEAALRFLDSIDWDICEYLTEEDKKQYKQAFLIEYGNCPFCEKPKEEKCDCA